MKFVFYKLCCAPLNILLKLLSFAVKKRRDLWLYSSWFGKGFSDNSKHLFKYVKENHPHIFSMWLCKDKELFNRLKKEGVPCLYSNSFWGIVYQLRAGAIFYGHSVSSDFNAPLIGANTLCVQLWHGIPIKKIGFDDEIYRKKRSFLFNALSGFIYRRKDDLVIASSEYDKLIYSSAFKVPIVRIEITGAPRNDVLCSGGEGRKRQCIYLPTFRGAPYSEFKYFSACGFDFEKMDSRLDEAGVDLHVKLHPVQVLSEEDRVKILGCKRIKLVDRDDFDIHEELDKYDVLISDFSSIVLDYILTDKPIIMATFDYEEYLKSDRQLYFDYKETFSNRICSSWDEVVDKVCDVFNNSSKGGSWRGVKDKFHFHDNDGRSSERVFELVLKTLAGFKQ